MELSACQNNLKGIFPVLVYTVGYFLLIIRKSDQGKKNPRNLLGCGGVDIDRNSNLEIGLPLFRERKIFWKASRRARQDISASG